MALWYIVDFTDGVEIVPDRWFTDPVPGQQQMIRWPRADVAKKIRRREMPRDDWDSFSFKKILSNAETWPEAVENHMIAMEESDVEKGVAAMNDPKQRKKRHEKKFSSDGDVSDDEDDIDIGNRGKSKIGAPARNTSKGSSVKGRKRTTQNGGGDNVTVEQLQQALAETSSPTNELTIAENDRENGGVIPPILQEEQHDRMLAQQNDGTVPAVRDTGAGIPRILSVEIIRPGTSSESNREDRTHERESAREEEQPGRSVDGMREGGIGGSPQLEQQVPTPNRGLKRSFPNRDELLEMNEDRRFLTIIGILRQLTRELVDCHSTMRSLQSEVRALQTDGLNPNAVEEEGRMMPFRDWEGLTNFASRLQSSPGKLRRSKAYLRRYGGVTGHDTTRRILAKLVTDDLAENMNMLGRGDKMPFAELVSVNSMIIDLANEKEPTYNMRNQFETTSKWLKEAKRRKALRRLSLD